MSEHLRILNWNYVDRALRWIARISIFVFAIPSAVVVLIIGFLFIPIWFQQLLDNSYETRLRGDDAKEVCGDKRGSPSTITEGTNTKVAFDDSACIALSLHEQQGSLDELSRTAEDAGSSRTDQLRWSVLRDNEVRYIQALRGGRILSLKPGLKTKSVKVLYAENGRLVPSHPTSEEDMRKNLAVGISIVSIQEGTMKGKLVCVPGGALSPRWGPML